MMKSSTRIRGLHHSPASLPVMKGTLAGPPWPFRHCHTQPFHIEHRSHCGTMADLMLGVPSWLWGSSGRDYPHCRIPSTRHSAWHIPLSSQCDCFREEIWPRHSPPWSCPVATQNTTRSPEHASQSCHTLRPLPASLDGPHVILGISCVSGPYAPQALS